MSNFTARVELHEATWADYEKLHEQMEAQGFYRMIRDNDGRIYHLPTAEYIMQANLTAGAVLERAKAAAATTRKRFSVFVTTATEWNWYGLAPVAQEARQ